LYIIKLPYHEGESREALSSDGFFDGVYESGESEKISLVILPGADRTVPQEKDQMESLRVSIKGVVQGVGFRPFVYKLARELRIKGFVTNTSEGVAIAVEGEGLDRFVERLRSESPPLSKIMSIEISPAEARGFRDFTIRESRETGSYTLLSPDISVCGDCLNEMFDGRDRRYRYPFINCTNCGPRYSITQSVPYDRTNTTMRVFAMCPQCAAEYADPGDRRFHAQPNACPACGPQVSMIGGAGAAVVTEDAVHKAIELLRAGMILGIKGLGGFHISCDAAQGEAVMKLRERKRRNNKPFALMAPDIGTVKKFCRVSEDEESLLLSPARPIVLLRKLAGLSLPEALAPNNRYIGFMLPYTPLHYLLFSQPPAADDHGSSRRFDALVMTSGNIAEEPLVTDNDEAVLKLSVIVDAFLVHNRDIFMRVDDTVLKICSGDAETKEEDTWRVPLQSRPSFIRRSRGYVPDPIPLPGEGPDVLGCGADLKNTFTLTKGGFAIPSQHIGDMENYETLRFFEETLRNLKSVYRTEPQALAYDLHPGYLSTQWALGRGMKSCGIQHHYAHIASVMAEKGLRDKVIGVSFDGTGYGEDGALWGGEFLIAGISGYKRAGHLECVPLPGGASAIREPWRTAVSYLKKATGDEIWDYLERAGFVEKYAAGNIDAVLKVSEQRTFSPLSSGAGRLFDAVAALMGVCDRNTFEGEAAMALESLLLEDLNDDYPVDIRFSDPMTIDFSMAFLRILGDIVKKEDRRIIASRFHNTVASAIIGVACKLSAVSNIGKVVLSGGVFQNSYLLHRVQKGLGEAGLNVYVNELVPCNDAGISLGQAYILRERIKAGMFAI
jgi:hydrogenase maturation protein HypF